MKRNPSRPTLSAETLKILRTTAAILTVMVLVVGVTVGFNMPPRRYWPALAAALPALAFFRFRALFELARAWKRARERWMSHGPDVERVSSKIFRNLRSTYIDRTRDDSTGFVDDKTWHDLDLGSICDDMDVCFTMAGRNELCRLLRHSLPAHDESLRRSSRVHEFLNDAEQRERIAFGLSRIGEERDADPASLLWGDSIRRDRLNSVFLLMTVLAAAALIVALFVNPSIGLVAVGVLFIANMWLYFRKVRYISSFIPALRVLGRMINVCETLPGLEQYAEQASEARGALKWLLTGAPNPVPTPGADITEVLLLYLKIYFLIDLLAYDRIVEHLIRNREAFRTLYRKIGALDAEYALASYRARRGRVCDAVLSEKQDGVSVMLEIDDGYHPHLAKPVPNSVTLTRPGTIVTGTNMAGKSTFLRMVGINVLLAQTAGYAFASGYQGCRFRVLSSIEKKDSLAEGKSFYYDEAERIFTMIEQVQTTVPTLLLIDELLSGTNSVERVSASVAIFRYLADRNALTIAATHAVDVAHRMRDRYAVFYFTDDADSNGLIFDYHIKEGVVATRNAIKLLELIGYPDEVIQDALRPPGEMTGPNAPEG